MSKCSSNGFIKFYNGVKCPSLGLGTYLMHGNDCYKALKYAISLGYRHIDTAPFYKNEFEVGRAVADVLEEFQLKRDDLFITTKLISGCNNPELILPSLQKSLSQLNLDYVDLYLIHTPVSKVPAGDEPSMDFKLDENGFPLLMDIKVSDIWREMEKCQEQKLTKSIGVSNFNSMQISEILEKGRIKPVTNQVEMHPYLQQHKLQQFCNDRDITLTAYRPLGGQNPKPGKPSILKEEVILKIAKKHNKSPAQILLRWNIEKKWQAVLVKASKIENIENSFQIFDFSLDDEDLKLISTLDRGMRYCPFTDDVASKQYPFHIEY